jgi:hypothetical protein
MRIKFKKGVSDIALTKKGVCLEWNSQRYSKSATFHIPFPADASTEAFVKADLLPSGVLRQARLATDFFGKFP